MRIDTKSHAVAALCPTRIVAEVVNGRAHLLVADGKVEARLSLSRGQLLEAIHLLYDTYRVFPDLPGVEPGKSVE